MTSEIDPSVSWPPPDPDRISMPERHADPDDGLKYRTQDFDRGEIDAFRKRQREDLKRWEGTDNNVYRRQPFYQRYTSSISVDHANDNNEDDESEKASIASGEESWRNSEGERLEDFGVDADVEFYDEDDDDVPIAELIARRKAQSASRFPFKGID